MQAPAPRPERRITPDRRRRPTSFWSCFRPGGRRRGFRRAGEGRNAYVDCASPRVAILALAIMAASVLDAFFTLLHVGSGAREVNPLMYMALEAGVAVFIAAKTGVTGLGIVFLSAHQHMRLSRFSLHGIACLYGGLLAYHGFLFLR